MPTAVLGKPGLTGNQLKLLAMIAMTCDHVGLQLLPHLEILRIIGRLALPIYAYLIAEGCRHTRSRRNYLLRLAGLGLLCQVVYFLAMGSLYQCILITFSLSVCLIWALDTAAEKGDRGSRWGAGAVLAVVFFVSVILPELLPRTDFAIDYGLVGILLPVMIYYGKPKWAYLTAGLVLLALGYGGNQWFALLAVPLLMLYNGQRGRGNLGKVFYLYYPLHLVVIYGLSLVLCV